MACPHCGRDGHAGGRVYCPESDNGPPDANCGECHRRFDIGEQLAAKLSQSRLAGAEVVMALPRRSG